MVLLGSSRPCWHQTVPLALLVCKSISSSASRGFVQHMPSSDMDIESLRSRHYASHVHSYSYKDTILYALALGYSASEEEIQYTYENHPCFSPVPTYAIIAAHPAIYNIPLHQYVPGLKQENALHGEQYLRLLSRLPKSGRLVTEPHLVDIQDKGKGKGTVMVMRSVTRDADLGHVVAENEFVAFGLHTGGFGTPWPPAPRPAAARAANQPPNRPPDHEVLVQTNPGQAALYRLCGDLNPLHIDPLVAQQVGFPQPIFHGLCTLGVSVKAAVDAVMGGNANLLRSVKVRFAKHVFPGDTLCVRMWCDPAAPATSTPAQTQSEVLHRVVFETIVMDRDGVKAITNAAVEYADTPLPEVPAITPGASEAMTATPASKL